MTTENFFQTLSAFFLGGMLSFLYFGYKYEKTIKKMNRDSWNNYQRDMVEVDGTECEKCGDLLFLKGVDEFECISCGFTKIKDDGKTN